MPYNFAPDSFHTKKLCSRLTSREVRCWRKNGRFAFLSPGPFGDLEATHDNHLRLIGKRVVDFLLVLIELVIVFWFQIYFRAWFWFWFQVLFICPIAIAYSMGQIIKLHLSVCVSVGLSEHSHGRISWSIFTKIGKDVIRTPKRKNQFVGG